MIRRVLPGPSPEERAFDQFADKLATDPAAARQAAATDLERFAVWVRDSAQAPLSQLQEPDPILEQLLARQRLANLDPPGQHQANRDSSGEHQAALKSDPDPPNVTRTWSFPGERVPTFDASGGSSRQIGWARVPTYLAAALVLCVMSIAAYATLLSGGAGKPEDPNLWAANLSATKAASAPRIIDVAAKLASAPTIVDPQPRVTVDGVDIVIVSWELTSTIDTAFADELPRRGAFLVLQATLTNTRAVANGDAPFKVLAVIDENDELFEIDKYGTVLANDTIDGAESLSNILLESGEDHVVYLVFDVPATSHAFALTNANGSFKITIVEP